MLPLALQRFEDLTTASNSGHVKIKDGAVSMTPEEEKLFRRELEEDDRWRESLENVPQTPGPLHQFITVLYCAGVRLYMMSHPLLRCSSPLYPIFSEKSQRHTVKSLAYAFRTRQRHERYVLSKMS